MLISVCFIILSVLCGLLYYYFVISLHVLGVWCLDVLFAFFIVCDDCFIVLVCFCFVMVFEVWLAV